MKLSLLFLLVHATQFERFSQSGTFEKCLENVKLRKNPMWYLHVIPGPVILMSG